MNRQLDRWPLPIPAIAYNAADTAAGAAAAAAADKTVDKGADTAAADAAKVAADAAAAAGKTDATKTAIEREGDPAKTQSTPADFPADWRDRYAAAASADGKADPKLVDRLKRYDSPLAFAKAGIEAQNRILSGKVTDDTPMPDETKDAEGAKKWREERGIPADPTGYKLPDEVVTKLMPEDKPILENYTAYAHKLGIAPAEVARSVSWYTQLVDAQAEARNAADKEQADTVETDLLKEWGPDFKANKTLAGRIANETIPGVNIFTARLADGRMIGNIPEVAKGFAQLGLLKYGDVAFAGGEAAKATESRKAELLNIMKTDIDKWNASDNLRKELFDIQSAEEKRNPPR